MSTPVALFPLPGCHHQRRFRREQAHRHRLARLLRAGTFLVILLVASTALADDSAKKLLAVIDYIDSDYKNAVQAGKILNASEYQEQLEFSKRVMELFQQLKQVDKSDKAGIQNDLKILVNQVEGKADPKAVSGTAAVIEKKIRDTYNIIPHPRQLPSFEAGKKIFAENCASCHGETGKGDGLSRTTMNPKQPPPANFTDPEFVSGLSPFKAFNAISFGVENTAMASFAALPEDERWQLAFYVLSFRFSENQSKDGASLLQKNPIPAELTSVAALSTLTGDQLSDKLKAYFPNEPQTSNVLAYLRRGVLEKSAADPLAIARARLREAAELYVAGNKEAAYQKAIEAYIDGYDLAEPALFAKDISFGRNLEAQFTEFRNAMKQDVSAAQIQKQQMDIEARLDQAAEILNSNENFPGYYSFTNSALIILREGLEAALILAAIFATLRVMGATQAIPYIHLGWILALIAGGLTWLATQTIMTFSGQHREAMEGFISVFAAVALFYVGYWLHTRTEARRWQTFIQDRVKNVLSGKKLLGLVGISFFAVYREAFEVVLFYQALWLQEQGSHGAVIWGFATGLVALILVTFAILKLGLRIPLKYFFAAAGTLLYIMAFIFAGNGVKTLQGAGWLPATPLSFPPQLPFLGIYPTVETLSAQVVLLIAFLITTLSLSRERRTTLVKNGN